MRYIIAFGVCATIFFIMYPQFDLLISGLVYSQEQGFIFKEHIVVIILYEGVFFVTKLIAIILILCLIVKWLQPKINHLQPFTVIPTYRTTLFLLLSLIMAPGIIVHQGFKEHWQRARPYQIEEFGGKLLYTPPLKISNQHGKSFVSGHAAMGFYLAAFALLLKGRKRKFVYITAISMGSILGVGRILQGGHFLSDIVFSGFIVLLTLHILYWAIFSRVAKHH